MLEGVVSVAAGSACAGAEHLPAAIPAPRIVRIPTAAAVVCFQLVGVASMFVSLFGGYRRDSGPLLPVAVSGKWLGIGGSAIRCFLSLLGCCFVEDWEGDVVGVASGPASKVLGDLEGVGVVDGGGEGDSVGTHGGFDEVKVAVVVFADEEMGGFH